MTIAQTIEAMVFEQNVRYAVIWNHEKREYQKLITLRDLLECLIFVADRL